MKKILMVLAVLFCALANAQEFASVDDALFFLDDNMNFTTCNKEGDYWVNPLMLQFEYDDAIYLHIYKGKITKNGAADFTEQELAKLRADENIMQSITWEDIKSVTVAQKDNEWWLTINGPYHDLEQYTPAGTTRTFLVENGNEAKKIKSAIEYVAAHLEK
jgi:hypothetical protein